MARPVVTLRNIAVTLLFCGVAPRHAAAQVLSGTASVNLNAILAQSLSISVTSGSTVNFTLSNGATATGDVSVVVQTSWNLTPTLVGAVTLYGYFGTPGQALSDGTGNYITSTQVEGRMLTGTPVTYSPFTQTGPVGPA